MATTAAAGGKDNVVMHTSFHHYTRQQLLSLLSLLLGTTQFDAVNGSSTILSSAGKLHATRAV